MLIIRRRYFDENHYQLNNHLPRTSGISTAVAETAVLKTQKNSTHDNFFDKISVNDVF